MSGWLQVPHLLHTLQGQAAARALPSAAHLAESASGVTSGGVGRPAGQGELVLQIYKLLRTAGVFLQPLLSPEKHGSTASVLL